MLKKVTSFVAAVAFASAASAGATYGFTNITGNNAGDAAIGEAQFAVELIQVKKNVVEFYFTNTGSDDASMVQLYWEDSSKILSSLLSWDTTTPAKAAANYGVDFSGGDANPSHLPGSSPKINDFSIQAGAEKVQGPKLDVVGPKGGKSQLGVGAGENVSIFFGFNGEYTELLEAMDNGQIVVGTHAQAFKSGGSESFVTGGTPPTAVPSPTAALAGMGLLGLLVARRRRRD